MDWAKFLSLVTTLLADVPPILAQHWASKPATDLAAQALGDLVAVGGDLVHTQTGSVIATIPAAPAVAAAAADGAKHPLDAAVLAAGVAGAKA